MALFKEKKHPSSKRNRPIRGLIYFMLVGGIFACLTIVAAIIATTFQLGAVSTRDWIITEMEHQTGRSFRVGEITYSLFPRPILIMNDVGIGDIPDGFHAEMFTADKAELHIAMLPLLVKHIRLNNIYLTQPQLYLERHQGGEENWRFKKLHSTLNASHGMKVGFGFLGQWALDITNLFAEDGHVEWYNLRNRHAGKAFISDASFLHMLSPRSEFQINGSHNRASFSLKGETDSLSRMLNDAPSSKSRPWQFSIHGTESANGKELASIGLQGILGKPQTLDDYQMGIDIHVADLTELNRLFPKVDLPSIRNVSAHLDMNNRNVANKEDILAAIQKFSIQTGEVNLYPWFNNGRIKALKAQAASGTAPVQFTVDFNNQRYSSLRLEGKIAPLQNIVETIRKEFSIQLPLEATLYSSSNNQMALQGHFGGGSSDFNFSGKIGQIDNILGSEKSLDEMMLSGHVTFLSGQSLTLENIVLKSSPFSLTGNIQVAYGEKTHHPSMTTGVLHFSSLDGDVLFSQKFAHASSQTEERGGNISSIENTEKTPPDFNFLNMYENHSGEKNTPEKKPIEFIIAWFADGNGKINITADSFSMGNMDYRHLSSVMSWQQDKIVFSPFLAKAREGGLDGSFLLDLSQPSPQYEIHSNGSIVSAEWLQKQMGMPPVITGPVSLKGVVYLTDGQEEQIKSSIKGQFIATMPGGKIRQSFVERFIPPLKTANQMPMPPSTLNTNPEDQFMDLHCLALKGEFGEGEARFETINIDTPKMGIQGKGSLNYLTHTLNLHLQPQIYIGSNQASSFVLVQGEWQAPMVTIERNQQNGRFTFMFGGNNPAHNDVCHAAILPSESHTESNDLKKMLHVPVNGARELLKGMGIVQ